MHPSAHHIRCRDSPSLRPCAGPILLEDMHMINKNAQFNREKVPERVVHARGMTAKGFFEASAPARACNPHRILADLRCNECAVWWHARAVSGPKLMAAQLRSRAVAAILQLRHVVLFGRRSLMTSRT